MLDRIETRTAVIGEGLVIRRALPSRGRRLVGAWCFLDHAGPRDYGRGEGLAVGPHPHIGLQTFTWMIEGEAMHRDSLGYEQVIRPGQVNLMTAGQGIAHAEDAVDDKPGRLHAAQLWIALPDGERHRAPAFAHHPELPALDSGGFRVTVLAGSAFGLASPAEVFSPLVGLDLAASAAADTTLELDPGFEHAALVLRGEASVAGETLAPGTLLYLGLGRRSLALACEGAAQVLVIGGAPLEENVLVWWNFVARSQDELEQATRDWNTGARFGKVRGSPSAPLSAPDLAGIRLGRAPA